MGCGVSKLDVPHGLLATTFSAKLRPLFHHRIEVIRRRRALKKATPSKKLLLRVGPDEDVDEIICHFNPLFDNTQKHTCLPEVRERCITLSKVSYKDPSSVKEESLKGKANQQERITKNVSKKGTFEISVREDKVNQTKDQNAEDKNIEGDNDDGRRIGHDNGDFPGSPSFRIYFTENDKGVCPGSPSSTENADNHKNARNNELQPDAPNGVKETAQSEAALSSKVSMATVKKGRKRRSLRQAINGLHGGVKSLQKVR